MPGELTDDVKARLKDEVGEANFAEGFVDIPTIHLETYADVTSNKRTMDTSTKVVLRPSDAGSVCRIVQIARDARTPVIALGGATTFFVSGGAVPSHGPGTIIVDLRRMDRIVDLDKESGTVTVEAGITIEHLNASLKEHGLWYPHHPESRNAATVGGAISVNGVSPFVTKYGQPGELVAALKVALSDGREYSIGNKKTTFENMVKMIDLFVGTEGSFGIIVEATLKVYPIPAARIKKLYGFSGSSEACAAVAEVARAGLAPEALMVSSVERIYNEAMLTILSSINAQEVLEGRESFVFVAYAGEEALVNFSVARTGEMIERCGGEPVDDLIAESYWSNLMEFGAVVTPQMSSTYGGRKYNSLRGGIPLNALPDFIALEKKAIPKDDRGRLIDDGVSTYVLFPDLEAIPICGILLDDKDERSVSEFNAWLGAVCAAYKTLGGTVSASVGTGTLLGDQVGLDMGESRKVAARLRGALDPDGLMNPGKIFPPRHR